jgi:hypothetical protein
MTSHQPYDPAIYDDQHNTIGYAPKAPGGFTATVMPGPVQIGSNQNIYPTRQDAENAVWVAYLKTHPNARPLGRPNKIKTSGRPNGQTGIAIHHADDITRTHTEGKENGKTIDEFGEKVKSHPQQAADFEAWKREHHMKR